MIFTHAAPAVTSASMAATSSSGATGECMRGLAQRRSFGGHEPSELRLIAVPNRTAHR
jgi:hypothetical protein